MIIAVTGASGFFAWRFINLAAENSNNIIIAVSSDVNKIKQMYTQNNVECLSNLEFLRLSPKKANIDALIHTAFSRQSDGMKLVQSLKFLKDVLRKAVNLKVKKFINLSSQSVYGSHSSQLKKENGLDNLEPEYLYSLAKCSSEILVEEILNDSEVKYVNLRLASLIGPSYFYPDNIIYKFIEQSFSENRFKIIGGKQNFSFLDVRDAANAVLMLLNHELNNKDKFLNLGPEDNINIKQLGDLVKQIMYEKYDLMVDYDFESTDLVLNSGMDSSELFDKLSWRPKYSLKTTISDTADFILKIEKERK